MIRVLGPLLVMILSLAAASPAAARSDCSARAPVVARALRQKAIKTPEEAAKLTSLAVFQQQIDTLDGIECFPLLESLNAQDGTLRDLRPLAGLTHLRSLDLRHNQIVDISPLAALTELRYLQLGNNQIADASAIRSLVHLSNLDLEHNAISDLSPLVTRTQYVELKLGHNRISDLSPLQKLDLKYLMRLELGGNQLRGLGGLAFSSVQILIVDLSNNALEDLGQLRGWKSIVMLDVSHNRITDVTPLADQPKLAVLDLSHNPIASLPESPMWARLNTLRLEETEVTDVTPLAQMKRDAVLHLFPSRVCAWPALTRAGIAIADLADKDTCHCPRQATAGLDCSSKNAFVARALKDGYLRCEAMIDEVKELSLVGGGSLDGIACFRNLSELSIEGQQLTDLRSLHALKKLERLALGGNAIVELAPLKGLGALRKLDLSRNRIVDLRPLAELAALEELELTDNRIVDVAPLGRLRRLTLLRLGSNRIAEVAPLAALSKLSTLELGRNQVGDFGPLRRARLSFSGETEQYRGSCVQIMRRVREGSLKPPLKDVFARCPAWEDEEAARFLPAGRGGCRLERICNDIVGVDCNSAGDGPYDYYDVHTGELISQCGGACMGGRCTNCPPKQLACPR